MDSDLVLYIAKRSMETALLVSAPVLLVALLIGVIAAMLQAVTSIRDMTLGVVLKLAGVGAAMLIFGGWMMQVTVSFTIEIFNHINAIGLGR